MRGLEDMRFTTRPTKEGKWIGVVAEFPDIKTRPHKSRLDAIDDIVRRTSERIQEIHERMNR